MYFTVIVENQERKGTAEKAILPMTAENSQGRYRRDVT